MPSWSSQRYLAEGELLGIDANTLSAAVKASESVFDVDPRLPPILTLKHLSLLSDTSYGYLRKIVSRELDDYKEIRLRKRVSGRSRYRTIHIPKLQLLKVQRWITAHILSFTHPSSASYAYHPNSNPVYAARRHCGCKWLLKIDLIDFFDNIAERDIFEVFLSLGYGRLIAFELARITTRATCSRGPVEVEMRTDWNIISSYHSLIEGFMPQGAPSSPMLSNLVMRPIDEKLFALAVRQGFSYTRYADDLIFSTKTDDAHRKITRLKRDAISLLAAYGFEHNHRKTSIRGPGARRHVLGMLVDGSTPRLSREFKDRIRQHLYYLRHPNHGPSKHAAVRRTSVSSAYHHLRGLIAWAERVEPKFGSACLAKLCAIDWPPIRNFNQLPTDL